MRNNILLLITGILAALVFTGCGTTSIVYNKYNIDRNLNKNVSKIDTQSVTINDNSKVEMVRKLNDLSISAVSYKLNGANMNTEISKEFFAQYFTVTNGSNSQFTVNTALVNYSIHNSLNPDNQNVNLEMKIEVLRKGKVILTKTYKKEAPGVVIYAGLRLSPTEMTIRKLQKGILAIYEQDFKPDLLAALAKQ